MQRAIPICPELTPPSDWLARADLDFEAAEILLTQAGPLSMVAFHIQQAIEKCLKGFLIHTGWHLRRVHDLEVLIQEAIARDVDLAPFLVPCQTITEYYIETRYPVGYHTPLSRVEVQANLNTTRALMALIRHKITP